MKSNNEIVNSIIIVIKKVKRRINTTFKDRYLRFYDYYFEKKLDSESSYTLESHINIHSLVLDKIDFNTMKYLLNHYLHHNFNILGSGWINIAYDTDIIPTSDDNTKTLLDSRFDKDGEWLSKIVVNSKLKYSKYLWQKITHDYRPVDWHQDFKSGFRWSSKKWYKEQRSLTAEGADIKIPWELSRMQHLTQLAFFAMPMKEERERIIIEYKNQVLDFIATNPTRLGVNWACTMDVAIRVTNLLISYDILSQLDESRILDDEFRKIFIRSVIEHGEHIISNLEWSETKRGNHYLANISGLLFLACYLKDYKHSDEWLVFATQELIEEMERQFFEDGGNFEGSTTYHRLSSEMMIYSTALILGINTTDRKHVFESYNHKIINRLRKYNNQKYNMEIKDFFPSEFLKKLYKSVLFVSEITMPNGEMPQIGDNDSGRFLKLTPVGEFISSREAIKKYVNLEENTSLIDDGDYWDETFLSSKDYLALAEGLFKSKRATSFVEYPLEKSFIESLSRNSYVSIPETDEDRICINSDIPDLSYKKTTIIKNEEKYFECKIQRKSFPNFGLHIFSSDNLYLCIVQGANNEINGHRHNDRLSFQLYTNKKLHFPERGTYVYTSNRKMRDEFRADKSHNIPVVPNEMQEIFFNTFAKSNRSRCEVVYYKDDAIGLLLSYADLIFVREFIIQSKEIIIKDSCNKEFHVNIVDSKLISEGYGKLRKLEKCNDLSVEVIN